MRPSVLTLYRKENDAYHTVFKTNHARKIYLAISVKDDICTTEECYYLDRSVKKVPKCLTWEPFVMDKLTEKIAAELDKTFLEVKFIDELLDKEDLIEGALEGEKKKILLLLKKNNQLRTIFKNKYHRAIYLEITLDDDRGCISECHYADERSGNIPHGLTSIYFPFSLKNVLRIVNDELEGGFSDAVIADEYTVALDQPICGSI